MELTLQEDVKKLLTVFLLILLPLLLILIGVIAGFANALYYILTIFWFGMGVIFFDTLY